MFSHAVRVIPSLLWLAIEPTTNVLPNPDNSCHVLTTQIGEGLAYIAHVVDMKVDEFTEGLQARYTGLCQRLTMIDLA